MHLGNVWFFYDGRCYDRYGQEKQIEIFKQSKSDR